MVLRASQESFRIDTINPPPVVQQEKTYIWVRNSCYLM